MKLNLVKSTMLALGIAALASPVRTNAQTIVYSSGGSSAMQGNYGDPALGGSPNYGAMPQLLSSTVAVGGFKAANQPVFVLGADNVVVRDPATTFAETSNNSAAATTTTAATAAGVLTIPVVSSAGFGVGDQATIDTGVNAETLLVASTTATTITLTSATTKAHANGVAVSDNNQGTVRGTGVSALVLFTTTTNTIAGTPANVLILVRLDSGHGVRFVSNAEQIASWGTFYSVVSSNGEGNVLAATGNTYATVTPAGTTGYAGLAQFLVTNQNTATERMWNGLSDVAADTVVKFAPGPAGSLFNFTSNPIPASGPGSLIISGLTGLTAQQLAVQTLLVVFNQNEQPAGSQPLGIDRDPLRQSFAQLTSPFDFLAGYNWTDLSQYCVNFGLAGHPTLNVIRERASGTRMTELLTVQRTALPPVGQVSGAAGSTNGLFDPDNVVGALARGTNNIQFGTGPLLNTVNANNDALGYAFVTGAQGLNNRINVRVAIYGEQPYPRTAAAAGNGLSLPNQNGQANYGAANYYPGTAGGSYTLWAFANEFTALGAPAAQVTVAGSIVSVLNAAGNAALVHGLGFTQLADMLVSRSNFISGSNETVFDGGMVSADPNIVGGATYIIQ